MRLVPAGDNPCRDLILRDGTRLYYKGNGKYGADRDSSIGVHIRDLQKSNIQLFIAPPEKEEN